jgi:hypothetical protein
MSCKPSERSAPDTMNVALLRGYLAVLETLSRG